MWVPLEPVLGPAKLDPSAATTGEQSQGSAAPFFLQKAKDQTIRTLFIIYQTFLLPFLGRCSPQREFQEDCGQVAFAGTNPFRWDSPLRKNRRTFDIWDIQRFAPATSLACSLRVVRLGVIER